MSATISPGEIRRVFVDQALARRVVVADLMDREMITVFPHDTLTRAMEQFGRKNIDQMPVVKREDPRRVVGVIERPDVIRRYHHE